MGLITPSPNPVGVIADFICSALNQNIGAYSIGPAGVAMERRTLRWLTDLVGYGPEAGGNLTSGGMMANFIGLKLARDWASGDRAQQDGVQDRWAVYTSEEPRPRPTAWCSFRDRREDPRLGVRILVVWAAPVDLSARLLG
jgi:L-2,4-diaminobutyrate decarboxylase